MSRGHQKDSCNKSDDVDGADDAHIGSTEPVLDESTEVTGDSDGHIAHKTQQGYLLLSVTVSLEDNSKNAAIGPISADYAAPADQGDECKFVVFGIGDDALQEGEILRFLLFLLLNLVPEHHHEDDCQRA